MSHSQFHSTNLFILRHAWLNLWDKHMTTGRINQVTTFQKNTNTSGRNATFSVDGVHFRHLFHFIISTTAPRVPSCDISNRTTACSSSQNTLFPGLTNFRHISPCPYVTKIMAFKENYSSPALIKQYDLAQSRRILNWLIATVLARGKNIHIPSSLQAQKQCLTYPHGNKKTTWLKSLFQISTSPMDRQIIDSEQDKPVIPYYSCRGILDRSFCPPTFNLPYTYSTCLTIHSSSISDVPSFYPTMPKEFSTFSDFPTCR